MEYHSAIKRNKTGSFVETCMDLQTLTQREVRENRKTKKRKTNTMYLSLFQSTPLSFLGLNLL